jgi:LPXTG-motif cell wall-anchored protein
MKKLLRGVGIVSVAAISAFALSACTEEIVIDSLNGQGTCGGTAFTLTTDQDESGEDLSISYTGPSTSDMSLFLAQGFYIDEVINTANAEAIGDVDEAYALKLDVNDLGWSTSGSGNTTTYSFSGSIETLIDNGTTYIDEVGTDPNSGAAGLEAILNGMMPGIIGVNCDTSDTTGAINGSWAAAQSVFPNNMLINGLEVVSSEPTTNGVSVTLRYPADALTAFGAFDAQIPFAFNVFDDDPDVSNDSVANMWAQGFGANSSVSAGSATDNNDGTFTTEFFGANNEPMPDGDFLLITIIPNGTMNSAKVVFSSFSYSAANGFSLESLPFLPELPASSEPTLPDTGVSSTQVGLIAGSSAVLALAGIALVAIRRRSAQQ